MLPQSAQQSPHGQYFSRSHVSHREYATRTSVALFHPGLRACVCSSELLAGRRGIIDCTHARTHTHTLLPCHAVVNAAQDGPGGRGAIVELRARTWVHVYSYVHARASTCAFASVYACVRAATCTSFSRERSFRIFEPDLV